MQAERRGSGANSELAMVALSAAIQLSRMLKQQEADPSPVKRLEEELQRTSGTDMETEPDRLDPRILNLFSGAFVDTQKETMRASESIKRISNLLQGLRSEDPAERRSSQEGMRAFCLALHSKLLAEKFPYKETETVLGDGLRQRIR